MRPLLGQVAWLWQCQRVNLDVGRSVTETQQEAHRWLRDISLDALAAPDVRAMPLGATAADRLKGWTRSVLRLDAWRDVLKSTGRSLELAFVNDPDGSKSEACGAVGWADDARYRVVVHARADDEDNLRVFLHEVAHIVVGVLGLAEQDRDHGPHWSFWYNLALAEFIRHHGFGPNEIERAEVERVIAEADAALKRAVERCSATWCGPSS